MAQRQEGQEPLISDAKIVDEDLRSARDIAKDCAVVLHHASGRAASAAGVDETRSFMPGNFGYPCINLCPRRSSIPGS